MGTPTCRPPRGTSAILAASLAFLLFLPGSVPARDIVAPSDAKPATERHDGTAQGAGSGTAADLEITVLSGGNPAFQTLLATPFSQTPMPEVDGSSPAWTYERFREAAARSGRDMQISAKTFAAVLARKGKSVEQVRRYLIHRLGRADPAVVEAYAKVPREYFHYNYQHRFSTASQAYEAAPKPWAVGYGSALSDLLGQVYMTQLAAPKPTDVVLEIGTGSGYQIALLSRMVSEAYSIEIIKPLGERTRDIFAPIGYTNVHTRVGDGYFGWPEVEGGFDIIMLTCAASYVSPELLKQLRPGGRLLVPIGQPFKRGQILYVFTRDAEGRIHSRKDSGVYFIPMTGYLQARTAAAPSRPATAAGAANVPARTKPAMNGTTAAVAPAKAAAATVAAPGPNALQ